MLKANRWSNSVPRAELEQRARDARLRLERLERLLVPRALVTEPRRRRILCLFSFGEGRQGNRTRGPLSHQRPSRMPKIQEEWLALGSSYCRGHHPSTG
jgi:hypothetical protein